MCIEQAIISNNPNTITMPSKKFTYSIKQALKQLFKQHKSAKLIAEQNLENSKKAASLESIESLENSRNADIESECASLESYENDINERLAASHNNAPASCDLEDYDFVDISTVPVHFVRTAHGTFFWTATPEVAADQDLIEPLYCGTSNQIAVAQMRQDRWAQA